MKAQDIQIKLEKAQETVAKKQATLAKYIKKADKIKAQITANGWDVNGTRYQKQNTPEHHDCYWMFCDLDDALDGIDRTKKAIAEKQGVVAKWQVALKEAQEKENLIERSFPEVLKAFQKAIIEAWDRWDLDHKAYLKQEYDRMCAEDTSRYHMNAYSEFIKRFRYSGYEFMVYTTEQEIHRDNVNASERVMINLWNRVKDITGDCTDWSGLRLTHGNEWEGVAVNGFVIGKDGTAKVETIGAGGWNIQKFHYRTLVHKVR